MGFTNQLKEEINLLLTAVGLAPRLKRIFVVFDELFTDAAATCKGVSPSRMGDDMSTIDATLTNIFEIKMF
jgi:hypothetical protein